MTVPAYVDNSTITRSNTIQIRGNTISDITGGTIVAFSVTNAHNVLLKNNKAIRIRSTTGNATGFYLNKVVRAICLYNVASRTNVGFNFTDVVTLDVYNLTAHNCNRGIYAASDGTFRNIALSAYQDSARYKTCYGIYSAAGHTQNLDYCYYNGLLGLVEAGTVTTGSNVEEKQTLYLDEPNDDLTPDYISELVNSGTANALYDDADIGGIETSITDETTCKINYFYDLIDNTFWDIDNPKAAEVSLIKAFQSRVLAASEVDYRNMIRDMHLNEMISTQRFSELFPMYTRYFSQSIFAKSIRNMFNATSNPATKQEYNSAIGGYNLLPTFVERQEDNQDGWILGESWLDYNNWLNSNWGLQYGIFLDVLGVSTISSGAFDECYNNVMNSVADVAPVGWLVHNEAQPTDYFLFTEGYNEYDSCTLTNMQYNDDYAIFIKDIASMGVLQTPVISTIGPAASGVSTITTGPSGGVEISVLDRVYSESITRKLYYREGAGPGFMGSWIELTKLVSSPFYLTSPYVQFKITVENILRMNDYEFVGLCTRPYNPARIWIKP